MDDIQFYHAKVSTRTKLHYLRTIRQKLSANRERLSLFKSTVFGDWLNIKTHFHDNHLLHYLLQHQRKVQNPDINTPFYFDIGQHSLEFGRQEMCLILGFRFGDVSFAHCHKRKSGFKARILKILRENLRERTQTIKAEHLLKILNDPFEFGSLTNDDAVRVCLLLILESVFMGKQERSLISENILVLVDDLYAWNAFPWGEYIWEEFHNKVYNAVLKVRDRHLSEIAEKGASYVATYTLCGFAFALKVYNHNDSVIPRALAWEDGPKFENNDYDLLFGSNYRVRLLPTDVERNQLWWSSSLDYFGRFMPSGSFNDVPPIPDMNTPKVTSGSRPKLTPRRSCSVVRTKVHRSTHIRTEVRRYVEKAMPQVYEQMPPSATVATQMADMQNQINHLRQLVGHLKPDGVTHMTDMDAVIPPSASFVDQMACMQRQISGLQKCIRHIMSDKKSTQNDDNMDVDHDSKISSQNDDNMDVDHASKKSTENDDNMDVEHDSKEDVFSPAHDLSTQEVQDVVDNLVGSPEYLTGCEEERLDEAEEDVYGNEVANASQHVPVLNDVLVDELMDDPAKSDAPFKPDVPVKNDDQDVTKDAMVNDPQFSDSPFKPDVPVKNDDEYVVEEEMDILLFDNDQGVPENDMKCTPQNLETAFSQVLCSPVDKVDVQKFDWEVDSVKTVRVPYEREKKVSKVLQSPYVQQPATTPKVVRKRQKRFVPNVTPKVIGPDGKEIQLKPWKENLRCNPMSTMYKAFVHPEILCFLDEQKKIRKLADQQLYRFPWGSGGTTANPQFWMGLLGRDGKGRGWLSDSVSSYFKPDDADWVMVGPFFCTMIIDHQLPLRYADGVTNGIPWFRQGIEKVFFPINEPDVHRSLGVLTISTGVIMLYDSLGSKKDEDLSLWDRNFRQIFQTHLPVYLIKSEVMARRNMDPNTYHVSFLYAANVPRQGGLLGDCGIWVTIFLNRLSQNKSLIIKKPVQAALAYREHLAEFYW
ncbi:phospholipase-like protein [Artemisia annua]|uniref:Phospholipase-like protein n=1 Tax=Artemisia annua TaxID=35608 RepID=A0A2U1L5C6_ARTAN|nr:phospholipase-like protein [Artemisia annua]